MAIRDALFLLLVITTMGPLSATDSRQGDILHSACSEACHDWEESRKQCFDRQCKQYIAKDEDFFPCYLLCWEVARMCVTRCTESFFHMYYGCSRLCLGKTGKAKSNCRHACVVDKFRKIRHLVAPAIPGQD